MLRKIIRAIIPARGEIFFNLFVEGAENVHQTANIFANIISAKDKATETQLSSELRQQRQKALEIEKKVMVQLNNQFITPLDRGDIQELSVLLLKLTKRIVKTNSKLQIYAIDIKADDCLIGSATTLQNITKVLVDIMHALKAGNYQRISKDEQRTDEFDENGIEDLRRAMKEMYSGNYDTMTILKLKEIYKSIESAIDTSASIADLVMQISIKDM
ncbi:MAG: hypothetical protein E6Q32_07040 [Neisseriales bacterium]|jgi:uncharacterized protein Yka (UPF0111/DUF47 family)|nr:hypothetical protein [Burkholderiales bacterium]RTL10180.1 MAG: hypothetical protein EKK54_11945 [Neisseriaceae bacterium]TXJ00114.1 MAG: hypothetical protein E6Q32_07040 [Neisseriales bacterium]HRG62911.1 hypothetical protein [Burkholderiales bacterium]